MNKYVALLRGINVSGVKKFPKAEQLQMLDALKFTNPQVYIHTGNWVFETTLSCENALQKIQEAILKQYGWEVPVLVFSASEMLALFQSCPFSEEIKEKSYFTLLATKPIPEMITKLKTYNYPDEEYHVAKRCIYFYPAKGAGKAKMSNNFFENKLKVAATSRNYKTMLKLITLSQ